MKTRNDCGHPGPYGVTDKGEQLCYRCCGKQDELNMRQGNRIMLYLEEKENRLTNWPATLIIPLDRMRRKKHPACCLRIDVWFTFQGESWWGVCYGAMDSQACHCRKIKDRPNTKK